MAIATLIIGSSGSGKTASLRNLDPAKTLIIQPIRKPLPFPAKNWKEAKTKGDNGNVFISDNATTVIAAMRKAQKEIIVIDDFQYFLINAYMARRSEKSFEKFSEFAGIGYDLVNAAIQLEGNKRVYILGHSTTDDYGRVHLKTIGKMMDQVIVMEGLFTTVLRSRVAPESNSFFFSTKNDGNDTVKTPMGMFKESQIDNDLAKVDEIICEYYGIESTKTE